MLLHHRELMERINGFVDYHLRCGHIREGRVEHDDYEGSIIIRLRLENGENLWFSFSRHEIQMGGAEAFRYWVERMEDDIMRSTFRRWDGSRSSPRRSEPVYVTACSSAAFSFGTMQVWDTSDPIAEQRAKDLFILTAGKKAYDTLQENKPLPIKGSKGTKYTLHNRSTFCVERVKDGAKLCAVVPGVPLWDHLLGIKLMVENDEPAFLKTANVSGGGRSIGRIDSFIQSFR